jgi:HK97 family phage prohead protease
MDALADRTHDTKVEEFDGRFSVKADKPTYREIRDDKGRVIDYQDVKVEGYANTFNLDRGGDLVIPGAFAQHLEEYLSNPVLLVDHVRETDFAAGAVKTAYEDDYGLKVMAVLSNSPGEKMRDIRFKVVEGILRTFSIGGKFFGKAAGEQFILHKIELREISIVTVPMNKESLFEVKDDHAKPAPDAPVGAAGEFLILVDQNGQKYEIIP